MQEINTPEINNYNENSTYMTYSKRLLAELHRLYADDIEKYGDTAQLKTSTMYFTFFKKALSFDPNFKEG